MNKFLLFFVFFILLSFVSGASIDGSILDKFDGGESEVRVLIKMKTNNMSPWVFGLKTTAFEKNSVNMGRVNKEIDGYISSYINRDDFEMLRANNLIESIYVEQVYHTMLQDSVGIMNFSSSWNLESNGLNLTGEGQAACIIDTGINYSHPDFGGCTTAEFTAGNCSKVIGGWDFCGNDGDCSVEDDDPMDVEGHGTHVSGIVAANGGIRGVGPDIKIVMMKAANSSGAFHTLNLISAIDRCVANASAYNISVISMSLGGGQYDSYCDGADPGITNSINNAVANGISVVVATGNTGAAPYNVTTAGISTPACIRNATRVSATTKSDTYASYAFRHSFFKDILMATGGSSNDINSTVIGGGYDGKMGTSMATPMVAGAIAIINQYLSLSGQTKTPSEISEILNDTGVVLDDSAGSGYNFSRINVYSALLSLDVDAPNITPVSPVDNNINLTVNQTFTCNATDWQLSNVTLMVWNSSGVLYYNATNNLTGTENQTSFNLTNMSLDAYSWNCLGVDVLGNSAYSVSNYSLTIGGISTTLLSPSDVWYTNVNESNFSCRVVSDLNNELSNITLEIWNSSEDLIYNFTEEISGFDNTSLFNYNFSEDGNYSWNCLGVNNISGSSSGASNFSFVYDSAVPILVLTSLPTSETSSSVSKNFGFNVSDDNIANCSLIVDGVIVSTNSSLNVSLSQSLVWAFTPGAYAWKINCSDFAGNVNSSAENSFVITAPAVPISSSGGKGSVSVSSKTYEVSVSEIAIGYTKKLKKNEKVNFSIFDMEGGRHLLTVGNVEIDYVDLVIDPIRYISNGTESEPVKLRLGIGQSAKLNLTSAIYYDLFVKLNSIVYGEAELTIQLINEPIEEKVVEVVREEIVETEVEVVIDYFWVVLVLIVVLVGIVFIVVRRNKGKKNAPAIEEYDMKAAEKEVELEKKAKKLKRKKGKKKDVKSKKIKT